MAGRASSEKMESIVVTAEENLKWLREKVDDFPSEPAKSSIELNRRRDSCKVISSLLIGDDDDDDDDDDDGSDGSNNNDNFAYCLVIK